MKKFAVFDIDGTVFRWQLFHEIVFELIDGGHIPADNRLAIDEKLDEWRGRKYPHSWHDYEVEMRKAFVAYVKELPVGKLEAAADAVLKRSGSHVYTYTRDLIALLRHQDYFLIALSGSQDEVVQRFAKHWNFDVAMGQVHHSENGKYTGTIPNNKLLVDQKGDLLKEIVDHHNLSWKESIAVGDTRTDISMLELVEIPIAFNPSDDLFNKASEKGWKVVIERKNMIYELESQNGTYLLANANSR